MIYKSVCYPVIFVIIRTCDQEFRETLCIRQNKALVLVITIIMHFYIAPKHFSITLRSSLRNLCRCQFSTATPPQSSKTSRVRQHYAAISIGAALGSSILLYNYFVSSNKPTLDPSAFTAFTLTRRVPVSHNTDIFRFDLPRPMPTDLPIISFVRVKDDSMQVARPYTPISPTSERRFIDLMVKRYENG